MPTQRPGTNNITAGVGFNLAATDTLVVDAGITIASTNNVGVLAQSSTTVICNGTIASNTSAGIDMQGSILKVGATGTISGAVTGLVNFFGVTLTAENRGLIVGIASDGVRIFGNATFTNFETGTVRSNSTSNLDGAFFIGGSAFKLTNFGLVENTKAGGFAINSSDNEDSVDTITNNGTIKGKVFLGGGSDTLDSTKGKLVGSVDGGSGNDKLFGSAFADTLIGGAGRDTLRGGLGKDTMTGGTERDIFDFNAIKESVVGLNRDFITDFNRGTNVTGDDIDLSGIDARTTLGGNQGFAWRGTLAFTDVAGQLRFTDLGTSCLVQGEVNGDGKADFEILVKTPTLGIGDFIL